MNSETIEFLIFGTIKTIWVFGFYVAKVYLFYMFVAWLIVAVAIIPFYIQGKTKRIIGFAITAAIFAAMLVSCTIVDLSDDGETLFLCFLVFTVDFFWQGIFIDCVLNLFRGKKVRDLEKLKMQYENDMTMMQQEQLELQQELPHNTTALYLISLLNICGSKTTEITKNLKAKQNGEAYARLEVLNNIMKSYDIERKNVIKRKNLYTKLSGRM